MRHVLFIIFQELCWDDKYRNDEENHDQALIVLSDVGSVSSEQRTVGIDLVIHLMSRSELSANLDVKINSQHL